jgi:hypothetical protein
MASESFGLEDYVRVKARCRQDGARALVIGRDAFKGIEQANGWRFLALGNFYFGKRRQQRLHAFNAAFDQQAR